MTEPYKKISNNTWSLTIQEDGVSKDLYIELPLEAINQVGWDEGDIIQWEELEDGNFKLTKKVEDV
jgi:hypothetical protein